MCKTITYQTLIKKKFNVISTEVYILKSDILLQKVDENLYLMEEAGE